MSGVTVLNVIEKCDNYIWPFANVIFASAILIAALCFVLFLVFLAIDKPKAALSTFIVSCILFVGCYIWKDDVCKNTHELIQYEVTVSDEVKLDEFLKHYKIIDQRGKIFIVEEIKK